jgi:cell division protein ZapB
MRPDVSPSHDYSQWLNDTHIPAYRCGGSAGFTPASRLTGRLPSGTLQRRNFSRKHGSHARRYQTTFKITRYRLTCLGFLDYSSIMKAELDTLENKLTQLTQLAQHLRAENHQLRQALAASESQQRQCNDKLNTAKNRLQKLLTQLPEDA